VVDSALLTDARAASPLLRSSPPSVPAALAWKGGWGEGEGHPHLATPNTVAIGAPTPLRLHQDGEGDLYGLERHS
jgi:hypothetical protein